MLNMNDTLKKYNHGINIVKDHIIPPSSIQSFLIEKRNFPGIILTSFEKNFSNNYYNSIFDTGKHSLNYTYKGGGSKSQYGNDIQTFIQNISTTLAYSLFEMMSNESMSGDKANDEVADIGIIDELLYCYLENINCKVHRMLNFVSILTVTNKNHYSAVLQHVYILFLVTLKLKLKFTFELGHAFFKPNLHE